MKDLRDFAETVRQANKDLTILMHIIEPCSAEALEAALAGLSTKFDAERLVVKHGADSFIIGIREVEA